MDIAQTGEVWIFPGRSAVAPGEEAPLYSYLHFEMHLVQGQTKWYEQWSSESKCFSIIERH